MTLKPRDTIWFREFEDGDHEIGVLMYSDYDHERIGCMDVGDFAYYPMFNRYPGGYYKWLEDQWTYVGDL